MADNKTPVEIAGEVAKKYNIPEYIWKPILLTESSGNPNSVAHTSSEYSVGLFQVNVLANPQYRAIDLKDPLYNSEVAMRDFIKPAYDYLTAKGVTDQKQLAMAVYSGIDPTTGKYYSSQYGGIRPLWTTQTQNVFNDYYKSVVNPFNKKTDELTNDLNNVSGGLGKWFSGWIGRDSEISPEISVPTLNLTQSIVKAVIILGLIILLIILVMTLFPKQINQVSSVAKALT